MFGNGASPGFILCVGVTLQEVSEIARLLRGRAVVLAASDLAAARGLLAPVGGHRHHLDPSAGSPGPAELDPVGPGPTERVPISAGALVMDPVAREATVGGRPIHLSAREFDLLALLASDMGRAWTFADLTERVWGNHFLGDKEQLASTVKRLRRRLAGHHGCEVRSVHGIGYRLHVSPG